MELFFKFANDEWFLLGEIATCGSETVQKRRDYTKEIVKNVNNCLEVENNKQTFLIWRSEVHV